MASWPFDLSSGTIHPVIWQPTGDFLLLLADVALAGSIGILLLGRVKEPRTLWLLRGYLFLVALPGWCSATRPFPSPAS